ncbi:MAG TPA: GDP-mannose 4,6-dehydratase, partial [Candidatus Berkiella sp.]|nr:GDP-mannose 4,6-dehydratase [Candidatus Berkiella sp.]
MKKKALITGINGQDGSYLAEWLLAHDYEVHGLVRREAFAKPTERLNNILQVRDRIKLHVGDAHDSIFITQLISSIKPDEVYHLAAN